MYCVSNADMLEAQRLLGELQRLTGTDAGTKNIRRRASLLKRRLERKQPINSNKK